MKLRRAPQRRRGEPRLANVTRELVERRGSDVSRRALAFVDMTDIIERLSLVELGQLAAGWAHALDEQGVTAGDRVVVLANERPEWLAALLGAVKRGAIGVPCPPTLLPGEVAEIVRIADARVLVAPREAEKIVAVTEAAPPVLWLDDVEPPSRDLLAAVPAAETTDDDVALLYPVWDHGSRTVLAAHTHDSVLRGASRARHWLGAGRRDRLWCSAVPGSPAFLTTVFGAWAQGAEVVLYEPRAEAAQRLEALDLLRVTVLVQSAEEYRALAGVPGRTVYDLSRIREAVCLGEPVPAGAHAAFRDRFDVWIRSSYGRPETGIVAADPRGGETHTGSVGAALPGSKVAVVDERGAEVEEGEAGDLVVAEGAPGLFVGYWDDREATDSGFLGSWFLTGDRAVREPGDLVRLAFPAEIRALDDRRQSATETRQRTEADLAAREQEAEAERARAAEAAAARKAEERRAKAAERQTREKAKAQERTRVEQEKRQQVEQASAAELRRRQETEARRQAEREQKAASKAARDRARAAERAEAEARARADEERKREEAALARRQASARTEAAPAEPPKEVGNLDAARRRRAAEERRREAEAARKAAREQAAQEKRKRAEAQKQEAEARKAAEVERKRQAAAEAAAQEPKPKPRRSPVSKLKPKREDKSADDEASVVSRIGAYGITPKDSRKSPPEDGTTRR